MKDFLKNKFVTGVVVVATIILAGVAVFTAMRLYQLRNQAVAPTAPESEPLAWDCSKYTFSLDGTGVVKVTNNSSRSEPDQQAKVYINNQLVATFDVPALTQGQDATLGTVSVPQGNFSWKVDGTRDCSSSGNSTSGPVSCNLLTFTLSEPTPTPTGTPSPTNTPSPTSSVTPTNTPTPTEPPRGGDPSPTPTPTPVPTITTIAQATPTTPLIAQTSPTPGGSQLPAAGIAAPTLIAIFGGLFIIIISLALAI
ncbi:hypothetical protein A2863_02520 [Candidatus Woesebacteria bacterium RIFCSPHIGHO2_01_FULL_38_9b]|uniref:Uncharacterized protein n=1 Tax=Candidatus Woesebacteria bacterium RIFCSPHIGHO2_01_FULL_38_9b TaxID=1802493 RepID=A0A1F7Y4X2_9BACT|nr:MAG: hypothetical protein A2863_02520 [Candidatus Woesebacteria bacterium RIFCSPHIGHO2_01_FULL_38_9b]